MVSIRVLDIGLHAGYADFRHGAFVPKSIVQSLLDQNDLISFVLLSNQYPVLLANPTLRNGVEPATSVKAPHDVMVMSSFALGITWH